MNNKHAKLEDGKIPSLNKFSKLTESNNQKVQLNRKDKYNVFMRVSDNQGTRGMRVSKDNLTLGKLLQLFRSYDKASGSPMGGGLEKWVNSIVLTTTYGQEVDISHKDIPLLKDMKVKEFPKEG